MKKPIENDIVNKFYFISEKDMSGQVIHPRIPSSRLKVEDNSVNRICASMSINGCLCGIGGYDIGEIAYVHTFKTKDWVQPTMDQVPDAPFTGEVWVTEPVTLEQFTKIEITEEIESILGNMSNIQYGFKIAEEETDEKQD